MKAVKTICLIIVVLCFSTIAKSQDVIVKKDNTTILSKVTKITTTEIEYKKWSNLDGPIYTISKSEIISINYQNGEVEKFSEEVIITDKTEDPVVQQETSEQTEVNPVVNNESLSGYMERDGNELTLDGRELSEEEVLQLVGEENYQTYCSAKRQINTGRAFTAITLASFGVSILLIASGVLDEDEDLLAMGIGVEVLADVSLITTIVLKSSGKGRMNWVADDYNRKHRGYSMDFSPSVLNCRTPQSNNNYAMGLTLRFAF